MQEERRGNALERELHVLDVVAAHRELAAQVVAGRDARHDLDRPQRIVGDQAPELLQVLAGERLFGGDIGLLPLDRPALNRDGFSKSPSPFAERNRDDGRRIGGHRDGAFHEDEIDGRHIELVGSRRDTCELEPPLVVGRYGLSRVLQSHRHFLHRRAFARVDDGAANDSSRGRLC